MVNQVVYTKFYIFNIKFKIIQDKTDALRNQIKFL